KSFTKKPLETRMGKGKGPLESWVAVIRPANVLFEVDGVTEAVARESLRLAATKLPIKTRFISRHGHCYEESATQRDPGKDPARADGGRTEPAAGDFRSSAATGQRPT